MDDELIDRLERALVLRAAIREFSKMSDDQKKLFDEAT